MHRSLHFQNVFKWDQGRFFFVYGQRIKRDQGGSKGIKGGQRGSRGVKGDQGGSKGIKGGQRGSRGVKRDQGGQRGSRGVKGDQGGSKGIDMVESGMRAFLSKKVLLFLWIVAKHAIRGNGFLLTPTESFSFKHALLHLIILLKPAYQGYFNRIKNAPLSRYFQKGGFKGDQGRFFFVFLFFCLWANGIKGGQRGSRGINQRSSVWLS